MVMVTIVAVPSSGSAQFEERTSTLILQPDGGIRVCGVLPHNYAFRPATREDAIKLASHIRDYFDDGQHG